MRFLLFFLAILTLQPAWAGLPAPVAQALREADIPAASVALYVRQVDGARPLIAYQAEQAMNPASVMKLVTTYAGLEMLGPAYSWKTEI